MVGAHSKMAPTGALLCIGSHVLTQLHLFFFCVQVLPTNVAKQHAVVGAGAGVGEDGTDWRARAADFEATCTTLHMEMLGLQEEVLAVSSAVVDCGDQLPVLHACKSSACLLRSNPPCFTRF